MFILSATPFYCGVYGVVFWNSMEHCLQNFSKSFPHNSPPLLVLNVLIFLFVQVSTRDLKSLKLSKTYDFFLRKYIHVFLKKSSIEDT
jgi:hypothetical protein